MSANTTLEAAERKLAQTVHAAVETYLAETDGTRPETLQGATVEFARELVRRAGPAIRAQKILKTEHAILRGISNDMLDAAVRTVRTDEATR